LNQINNTHPLAHPHTCADSASNAARTGGWLCRCFSSFCCGPLRQSLLYACRDKHRVDSLPAAATFSSRSRLATARLCWRSGLEPAGKESVPQNPWSANEKWISQIRSAQYSVHFSTHNFFSYTIILSTLLKVLTGITEQRTWKTRGAWGTDRHTGTGRSRSRGRACVVCVHGLRAWFVINLCNQLAWHCISVVIIRIVQPQSCSRQSHSPSSSFVISFLGAWTRSVCACRCTQVKHVFRT